MMENELVLRKRIKKFKKEKNAVILAHNYQLPAIQEIADFLGDSLELAKVSKTVEADIIVFCGVRFMAETAKILSPGRKVLIPVLNADCPLADTIEPEELKKLKEKHPDAIVVCYVNTSAQIKALSDVCCTSSNAVKVVRNVPSKKVIFVPDRNLAWWVQKNVPEKEVIVWEGYCYVHQQFSPKPLDLARKQHPDAEIMVHPECRKEILTKADFVLSTSGMLKCVARSAAKKFIVGTEIGMIQRLKKEYPEREFYSLGTAKMCVNMKKIDLTALSGSLEKEQYEVDLDRDIIDRSRHALEEMVKYV